MSKIKLTGNASGTGTLTIAAPNTNSDRTLTLPDSAGEILLSDGDGSNLTGLASPAILQVKQTYVTAVQSFTSANTNTYVTIPGMSVSITPSSTSSKILVMYTANVSNSTTATVHLRIYRDSTPVGEGAAASNRLGDSAIFRPANTPYGLDIGNISSTYLDTPNTTSSITYTLKGTLGSTYNGAFLLNRSPSDSDDSDYVGRTASSITVMEIAG